NRNGGGIKTRGNDELAPRTRVGAPVRFDDAEFSDVACEREFRPGVGDRHRGLRTEQGSLRTPASGLEARELELDGQVVPRLVDEGIHATGEGVENPLSVGMVARPLAI